MRVVRNGRMLLEMAGRSEGRIGSRGQVVAWLTYSVDVVGKNRAALTLTKEGRVGVRREENMENGFLGLEAEEFILVRHKALVSLLLICYWTKRQRVTL